MLQGGGEDNHSEKVTTLLKMYQPGVSRSRLKIHTISCCSQELKLKYKLAALAWNDGLMNKVSPHTKIKTICLLLLWSLGREKFENA